LEREPRFFGSETWSDSWRFCLKYDFRCLKYGRPNATFAAAMLENAQQESETIPLSFRLAKGWRWLWFTLVGVLLYQFFTLQRPGFGELGPLLKGQIWEYLRALLGYYVLFELVSVFIFMRLAAQYVRLTGMDRIQLSLSGVLGHQMRFLPFVLGSILVFGPITNGLRYLAVFYPDYTWTSYFPEYFFTARMYVNYLLPF
jgi:two-component system LytT family response regulator